MKIQKVIKIVLFMSLASASYAEVDLAALEKRVAALEAEVATLKAQKSVSDGLNPDELDPETRRRLVAEEVQRRRAKREAAERKERAPQTAPGPEAP